MRGIKSHLFFVLFFNLKFRLLAVKMPIKSTEEKKANACICVCAYRLICIHKSGSCQFRSMKTHFSKYYVRAWPFLVYKLQSIESFWRLCCCSSLNGFHACACVNGARERGLHPFNMKYVFVYNRYVNVLFRFRNKLIR